MPYQEEDVLGLCPIPVWAGPFLHGLDCLRMVEEPSSVRAMIPGECTDLVQHDVFGDAICFLIVLALVLKKLSSCAQTQSPFHLIPSDSPC
jgi:hypothetical protein